MATYLLTAAPITDLDGAPVTGISLADRTVFTLAEADFPRLPALREWLADRGVAVVSEAGAVPPTTQVEDGSRYLLTAPASVSAQVSGIARSVDPCAACGLGVQTVTVTAPRIARAVPKKPLVTVMGACWVISEDLLRRLDDAGLSEGLARSLATFDDGVAWAVWPERRISGVAYPFGPEPCPVCGRASAQFGGRAEFVPPRYALGLALPQPSGPPGWWWHDVYGQALPVVSGSVVRALLAEVRDLGVFGVPEAGGAGAFLSEELR
jgi:hypothetical protein